MESEGGGPEASDGGPGDRRAEGLADELRYVRGLGPGIVRGVAGGGGLGAGGVDQVESRLFVVARVAEACNLSIPASRADPRGVLLPLVRRFAQAAGREGRSVKPSVEIQAGLAMAPRSLLSLGMLVYELLDGFASMPAMQARCTGLTLSLVPGERGARLELRFEEDASSFGRGPELFVALNYLATDLIAALADQLGATLVIGREGGHAGVSPEILRIDGIRCA